MKLRNYLVALILPISCFGQEFKGKALLPVVEEDGFYRTLLAPEISAKVNDRLTDIRIYDAAGREVPYLLQSEIPGRVSSEFIEYEILGKESTPRCCTSIALRNPQKTPIDNIHLLMKNAAASRVATLLGSDDQQNWFSLVDQFQINAPATGRETQQIKIVEFPWSNYEYYLLKIADSTHAPLNIISAGYFEEHKADGKYQELQVKVTSAENQDEKRTRVSLLLDAPYIVDKLEVIVSGSRYYRRSATLYEKRFRKKSNGSSEEYYTPITSFQLTSGRKAIIALNGIRGEDFKIEIDNHDSPPLQIASVKAFQLNRYLTSWLSAGDQYEIRFGQSNLGAPVYDIEYFRDSIPATAAILKVKDVQLTSEQRDQESPAVFTSKTIIWIAILGIAAVLGMMSFKLVKEQSGAKGR